MKRLIPLLMIAMLMLISACGNDDESENTNAEGSSDSNTEETNEEDNTESDESADGEMRTYESENGTVEVPANPERVVVLSTYTGNVLSLDTNVVGADPYSMSNPRYEEHLDGAEAVTSEDLEKIIELDPDLIIGLDSEKNLDRLREIAPTVTYTYGNLGYLEQHREIAKLLNKEEQANEWIEDFKTRAQEVGEEIKAEIGEDATVTVFENFEKQLYVFGDNFARGTEILYQEMDLAMPEKVEEMAIEDGFYALSFEALPEYAGDYIIYSKKNDLDTSFEQTETFQSIPAVQNDRIFEADAKEFYFNDPISLDYQLQFFKEHFLGEEE
ncbi:iron-hydroxamate ABC transporter substrate-binding protein [Alkalibacillus salilacus]|uniref:iron-hydroxamate ABC transporter substrate-binding protein n=1 Tax=Alkalibacillus salilacus TaxID=284582 RepID=UPI0027D8FBD5|nr:iron-hydroxamate ABC transporter substrate-binding protein [Alkalibacillus salilacus]